MMIFRSFVKVEVMNNDFNLILSHLIYTFAREVKQEKILLVIINCGGVKVLHKNICM